MKAATNRGIFDEIANLVCPEGHLHFAREADEEAFIGEPCGTTIEGRRCTLPLRRRDEPDTPEQVVEDVDAIVSGELP